MDLFWSERDGGVGGVSKRRRQRTSLSFFASSPFTFITFKGKGTRFGGGKSVNSDWPRAPLD